jgi:hypothetical protein
MRKQSMVKTFGVLLAALASVSVSALAQNQFAPRTRFWNGMLDEIEVHDRTLDEGEIALPSAAHRLTSCRVRIQNDPVNLALPSFTYSVWVYPTAVPNPIRGMRAFSTFGLIGTLSSGTLISIDPEANLVPGGSTTKLVPRFDIYTTATALSVYDPTTVEIPLNQWTHIVLTVKDDANSKTLKAYVNGAPLTSLKVWHGGGVHESFPGTFTGSVRY